MITQPVNANNDLEYKFVKAISSGDTNLIRTMLLEPNPEKLLEIKLHQSKQGLLHMACAKGNEEVVDILIENGIDVEAEDELKRKALHIAANLGCPKVLKSVLSKHDKSIIEHRDINGRTVFHASVLDLIFPPKVRGENLIKSIRMLLHKCESDDHKRKMLLQEDDFGVSPEEYAQYYGIYEFKEIMLELGMKPTNIVITYKHKGVRYDYWGFTNLMRAVFNSADVFNSALEDVASPTNDPSLINTQLGGITALHCAALSSVEKFNLLMQDPRVNAKALDYRGRNVLHYVCDTRNENYLSNALQHDKIRALVNSVDTKGMTPLHILVEKCRPDTYMQDIATISLLVAADASLFAVNKAGNDVASIAIKSGNNLLCRHLISLMSAEDTRVANEQSNEAAENLRQIATSDISERDFADPDIAEALSLLSDIAAKAKPLEVKENQKEDKSVRSHKRKKVAAESNTEAPDLNVLNKIKRRKVEPEPITTTSTTTDLLPELNILTRPKRKNVESESNNTKATKKAKTIQFDCETPIRDVNAVWTKSATWKTETKSILKKESTAGKRDVSFAGKKELMVYSYKSRPEDKVTVKRVCSSMSVKKSIWNNSEQHTKKFDEVNDVQKQDRKEAKARLLSQLN